MSDKLTMTLFNEQQGHTATQTIWRMAKAHLSAGRRMVLSLTPETRSDAQNAKFHAICSDIAKSGTQWAGKPRNAAEWKVLLVSGHAVATKEGSEVVPGLEGEFINLRESTALMSKKRGSSLIEYSLAFCAMNDVKIVEPTTLLEQRCGL